MKYRMNWKIKRRIAIKGNPSSSYYAQTIAKEADLVRAIYGWERPIDISGLSQALVSLKPREELVVRYRFGIYANPLTLKEVGIVLGFNKKE